MFRFAAGLLLAFAFDASAGEKLGPGGFPQTDPFYLTADYLGDFTVSQPCKKKTPRGEFVFQGQAAVYVSGPRGVEVFLDEFARRYSLDYCQ